MKRKGVEYISKDLRFRLSYNFVNVKLLVNLTTCLSFLNGEYQLEAITNTLISSTVAAKHDKVVQI